MPFYSILDCISDAVLIVKKDGTIIHCNNEIERIFGYDKDELVAQNYALLVPPEVIGNHMGYQDAYFDNPESRKMGGKGFGIIYGVQKNGNKVPVEVSLSHTTMDGDDIVIAIVVDISKRVKEQQEIEKSRAIYASLVENTSDHIFRINKEGRIEYINHVSPGLEKDQVIGSYILDLLPEDQQSRIKEVINKTLTQGARLSYETSYPSPLGKLHYKTLISPIIENGQIVGASLVSRDQTDEIKLRRKMEEQDSFIKSLHDNSLNGIYIYNFLESRNTYINSVYTDILGFTMGEINDMTGEDFFGLFHPDDRKAILHHMEQMAELQEGESSEIEYRFKTKRGDWIWCYSKDTTYEFDKNGRVISFIGAFVDITNHKMSQIALQDKNKELENFVAVASHDLKSPLNSIHKMMDFLKYEPNIMESESVVETVEYTQKAVSRMQNLVESLLHHTKIGSQKTMEFINLEDLLKEVLDDLKFQIDKTQAIITISQLPMIEGNRVAIRQLFQNLIANALKFNEGQPKVSIQYKDFLYHHQFEVKDNGIGIAPENVDDIFKIFQRFEDQKKFQGSGIGLANCKKIVQAHGGKIWVESELKKGSTFYFTLAQK